MSEFKFACPVCGQHITAASSTSGGQIECPTCFQKIVVPQAPAAGDAKFILSASQVGKPRPTQANGPSLDPFQTSPVNRSGPVIAGLIVFLCALGAVLFFFRARIFPSTHQGAPTAANASSKPKAPFVPMTVYQVPTNFNWTLVLTNAVIPETLAAGSIHGHGFRCERATLQGGNLTLRQGKSGPPDLGFTIYLFAKAGEELSGKSVEVTAERAPPLPRVELRWKDDQQPAKQNFNGGYALKVVFGDAAGGRMPGKLYICLPDEAKSFVAGTFDAEIRKPPAPKPRAPKPAKPPKPAA